MKRPKDKGTRAESELVSRLNAAGIRAHRAPNNAASHDVITPEIPLAHEVKHRKRQDIDRWATTATQEHGHDWIVWSSAGDRRSSVWKDVAIMPAETAIGLLLMFVRTAESAERLTHATGKGARTKAKTPPAKCDGETYREQ